MQLHTTAGHTSVAPTIDARWPSALAQHSFCCGVWAAQYLLIIIETKMLLE
jgi:hypothetical protein